MITFHKHKNNCPECDETEEALINLVAAHTIKEMEEEPMGKPTIIEGKKKINGHKAIEIYMKDLEKTMDLWQKFQGDSCYTDSDGKIC